MAKAIPSTQQLRTSYSAPASAPVDLPPLPLTQESSLESIMPVLIIVNVNGVPAIELI
jgi:hypothetical protein